MGECVLTTGPLQERLLGGAHVGPGWLFAWAQRLEATGLGRLLSFPEISKSTAVSAEQCNVYLPATYTEKRLAEQLWPRV